MRFGSRVFKESISSILENEPGNKLNCDLADQMGNWDKYKVHAQAVFSAIAGQLGKSKLKGVNEVPGTYDNSEAAHALDNFEKTDCVHQGATLERTQRGFKLTVDGMDRPTFTVNFSVNGNSVSVTGIEWQKTHPVSGE